MGEGRAVGRDDSDEEEEKEFVEVGTAATETDLANSIFASPGHEM